MSRVLALIIALLVTGPVAAGPAWQCLCTMDVPESCCCPHEEQPDNALSKGCCCDVAPRDAHSSSPAPAVFEHLVTMDAAPAPAVVAWSLPLQPASVLTVPQVRNTGPPPTLDLLRPVRLRP